MWGVCGSVWWENKLCVPVWRVRDLWMDGSKAEGRVAEEEGELPRGGFMCIFVVRCALSVVFCCVRLARRGHVVITGVTALLCCALGRYMCLIRLNGSHRLGTHRTGSFIWYTLHVFISCQLHSRYWHGRQCIATLTISLPRSRPRLDCRWTCARRLGHDFPQP